MKAPRTKTTGTLVAVAGVLLGALAGMAEARELVTVALREGATQTYLLAVPAARARAVALLFPGGFGKVDLTAFAGRLKPERGNFLIRARRHFVERGVATAVLDAPSDQPNGMPDEFRLQARHADDVARVIADLRARVPEAPVFLVGTSRGSVSAAAVGARLGGTAVAGVALTSSMFRAAGARSAEPGPGLSHFDFASLRVPVLVVHHREDGCFASPYGDAYLLAKRFPLVSVKGGLPARSRPCEALSAHGYLGKEAETVDAIVAWMRGRPYPREIE
jgi:pimeloyl-ACP methyl ester carboxylesterase